MSKTTPHNNYRKILNQNTFGLTQKPQFFKLNKSSSFILKKETQSLNKILRVMVTKERDHGTTAGSAGVGCDGY